MGKKKVRTQYAALPFKSENGQRMVMLVTSRETRRWIIPKGWPEKDLKPYAVAAREAFEEAGLIGKVGQKPFATFQYDKRLKKPGRSVACRVRTFLFEVEKELDDWPEKGQRERCWMSPAEAALLVTEAGLIEILLRMAAPPG